MPTPGVINKFSFCLGAEVTKEKCILKANVLPDPTAFYVVGGEYLSPAIIISPIFFLLFTMTQFPAQKTKNAVWLPENGH